MIFAIFGTLLLTISQVFADEYVVAPNISDVPVALYDSITTVETNLNIEDGYQVINDICRLKNENDEGVSCTNPNVYNTIEVYVKPATTNIIEKLRNICDFIHDTDGYGDCYGITLDTADFSNYWPKLHVNAIALTNPFFIAEDGSPQGRFTPQEDTCVNDCSGIQLKTSVNDGTLPVCLPIITVEATVDKDSTKECNIRTEVTQAPLEEDGMGTGVIIAIVVVVLLSIAAPMLYYRKRILELVGGKYETEKVLGAEFGSGTI